jgi:1,4-dihydroxy-2-naphthoate polyprenyltransferase
VDFSRSQHDRSQSEAEAAAYWRGAPGRLPPPLPAARTLLGALARTCRFDAALAATAPVAAVTGVAWWGTGRFDALTLFFTMAAAFFLGLGAHMLSEGIDRQRAQAPQIRALLQAGHAGRSLPPPDLHVGEVKSMGYIALLISLLCTLWLGLLVGWPMVLFGGVSLLLTWSYAARPLRYVNWGYGLGESGLFIGLGLLPAVAAYYAQSGMLDAMTLWSGVPFAMLGSLILMAFNLLNDRRDWLIRKRTLAVGLGRGRTIDLSTVLLIGTFAFILLAAVVSDLPLRTMIALLGLPVATGAYAQLDREDLPAAQAMRLYTAAIHSTLATALLYCLALITDRFW